PSGRAGADAGVVARHTRQWVVGAFSCPGSSEALAHFEPVRVGGHDEVLAAVRKTRPEDVERLREVGAGPKVEEALTVSQDRCALHVASLADAVLYFRVEPARVDN